MSYLRRFVWCLAFLFPSVVLGQTGNTVTSSFSSGIGATNAVFQWLSETIGPNTIATGDFGTCTIPAPPLPNCTLADGTGTPADPFLYFCSSALNLGSCTLPGTPYFVPSNAQNVNTHTHTQIAGTTTTTTNSTSSSISFESPPACSPVGSERSDLSLTLEETIGPATIIIGDRNAGGTAFEVLAGTVNLNINAHTATFRCIAAPQAVPAQPIPTLGLAGLLSLFGLLCGIGVREFTRRRC